MKKFFIILGIVLGLVVLAAFLVPIIFKDDIKAAIDKAMAESLNAEVRYDPANFGVTLFSHFPNPSAQMSDFGIYNRAPFDGETLFAVDEFEAVIDLSSVLFGDQIKIKGIYLEAPVINLKVLEDGRANWDIAIATDEPATANADTTEVKYNIGIDQWKITNGMVSYNDQSIPFKMVINGLTHNGSGDFTQDVIDIATYTLADSLSVVFDGTEYISDKLAEIDMNLRISDDYSAYEFQDNNVRLNDFVFAFAGGFKMLDDGYDMDLTFNSQDNSFKSLLSLVPGMYHDDFNALETSGQLQFEGMVKGKYDSTQYPAYNLTLNVSDAGFRYPDVKKSFSDIQMDLNIKNESNQIENTRVALNNFHLMMGDKPFDGKLIVDNLVNYPVDAELRGNIDLNEILELMPMEGLAMRGLLAIDVKANGTYDSIKQVMPTLDGKITLSDGYIKSAEFPSELDNFNVNALLSNESGDFQDFMMNLSKFSFTMDGEPFEGNLSVVNLNNLTWDLFAKGSIDLEKMSQVLALEDMELKGLVNADLNTKGNMAALEEERYADLPTSGNITMTNFEYSDSELPYKVTLSEAVTTFNPDKMAISKMDGTIGKSDFSVDGYVNNYLGYALNDNEKLRGTFNFRSNSMDLNEFMTEEETTTVDTTSSEPMTVIAIPKNIDMTLNSELKSVKMMDMEMTNVKGSIIARDGIASLANMNFDLLDGHFVMNGSYNTQDIEEPKYDFGLNIEQMSIAKAFSTFEIVKNYVPMAEKMTGNFSTDFSIDGLLDQNMSPVLSTVNGLGVIKVLQAKVQDSKLVKGITSVTKLKETNDLEIEDIKMKASIENGSLKVEPFDLQLLGYKATISGTSTLDGNLSYLVNMDVPSAQAAQLVSSLSGSSSSDNSITLPIKVSGTYDDPKFGLETSEMTTELKQALKEKAKDEAKSEVKDALDENLKEGVVKDAVTDLLGGKKSDSTQQADSTKQPIKEEIKEKATDKLKGLLKKKKNN